MGQGNIKYFKKDVLGVMAAFHLQIGNRTVSIVL